MSKLARVLLVEDDEVDVMTVRRAFKRTEQNLPLEVRGDGVRALSALRNGEIRVEGLLILPPSQTREIWIERPRNGAQRIANLGEIKVRNATVRKTIEQLYH